MAAGYDYLALVKALSDPLEQASFAWQMHLISHWLWSYRIDETLIEVKITPLSRDSFQLEQAHQLIRINPKRHADYLYLDIGQQIIQAQVEKQDQTLGVYLKSGPVLVQRVQAEQIASTPTLKGQLTAPMPATVVAILKKKGDLVRAGERLMVLEAMKMEHTIHAPKDGVLAELFYEVGSQVNEGAELLALSDQG